MKKIWVLSLIFIAVVAALVYGLMKGTIDKKDERTLHFYTEAYTLESLNHLWMTQTDRALMDLFLIPLRGETIGTVNLAEKIEPSDNFKVFKVRLKSGFKTPLGVELDAKSYLAGVRAEALASQEDGFIGGVFFDVVNYQEFLERGQSAGLEVEDKNTFVIRYSEPHPSLSQSFERLNLAFRSEKNIDGGKWTDPGRVDGLSAWTLKEFGSREIVLERNSQFLPRGPYDKILIHKRSSQEISQISDTTNAILYLNNATAIPAHFQSRASTDQSSFFLSLNCQKEPWSHLENRIAFWTAYNHVLSNFEPLCSTVFKKIDQLPKLSKATKLKNKQQLIFGYESSWEGADEREMLSAFNQVAAQLGVQIQLKKMGPRLSVEKISQEREGFDGIMTRKKFLQETTPEARHVFFCSKKLGVNWSLSSYKECTDATNFQQAESTEKLLRRDWCTQSFGQNRGRFYTTADMPKSPELIDARYHTKILGGIIEK